MKTPAFKLPPLMVAVWPTKTATHEALGNPDYPCCTAADSFDLHLRVGDDLMDDGVPYSMRDGFRDLALYIWLGGDATPSATFRVEMRGVHSMDAAKAMVRAKVLARLDRKCPGGFFRDSDPYTHLLHVLKALGIKSAIEYRHCEQPKVVSIEHHLPLIAKEIDRRRAKAVAYRATHHHA